MVVRLGGRGSSPLALSCRKHAQLQRGHHRPGDLVLDGEDVGQVAVEALRPELVAIRGVDQLRRDAQSGAGLADAAFQDVGHVELLAHGSQILALALEIEGRRTRSDAQAGDLGQRVDDLLRHAVGEVLLIVLGAHVHEGQDGDRGRGHSGARGRPASDENPPQEEEEEHRQSRREGQPPSTRGSGQLGDDVSSTLVATVGIAIEAAPDGPAPARIEPGSDQLRPRRRLLDVTHRRGQRGGAREGQLPGDHLIHHHAERVDVGRW